MRKERPIADGLANVLLPFPFAPVRQDGARYGHSLNERSQLSSEGASAYGPPTTNDVSKMKVSTPLNRQAPSILMSLISSARPVICSAMSLLSWSFLV